MTKFFSTINQYFATEPRVSVQSLDLSGLLVSTLDETSNDISVASTRTQALLISRTGSDQHHVRIDDRFKEAPTRPGDVSLIPCGVRLQSAWRTNGYTLKTVSLEFTSDLFNAFAPEIVSERFSDGHLLPSNYSPRPELASLAALLQREMDGSVRRGKLFSDAVIRLLALEIAATSWTLPASTPRGGYRPDPRVDRAIDFIEANFSHDISLLDIANASGLSITPLTAQFRRRTGKSPYAYVIDRRVRHAMHLLRTTDMPIAQVAVNCGFSDQSQLTRAVRARMGLTPRMARLGIDC
jgi:AraC family transcriptional regulator